VPVEAHFAIQLGSDHALHRMRAEALARRPLDWRAAALGPAEDETPSAASDRIRLANRFFGRVAIHAIDRPGR
jgi:hypothetical protein